MTRRASGRRGLARVESIEERLALPVPDPIPGQQALPAHLFQTGSGDRESGRAGGGDEES